uniref:Selenoprotein K n=1 Tax=Cacopsylla melanoneura TaxID=428564 RepID=A0A8D9A3Z2_9HEMI
MVYIAPDGSMGESRPLSVSKVVDLFWSGIDFIVLFFQTLINPNLHKKGPGYTTDFRAPSGGGGGGGGGGGQGPPRPPPRKKFGGFGPSSSGSGSMHVPFSGGGCSGGSCGM